MHVSVSPPSSPIASSPISLAVLPDDLDGHLIEPGDPGYDEARAVARSDIDRRPAAIARVANAADVARVISVARAGGLELAVRSGGHSLAGHGVSDGGIVLDLRDLRDLEIDVEARTAWAGAGLTAGEYTEAAAAHGLATGFGDSASVGIGGITLGGGAGFLARKHGLTIDDLLAAEIVTADGEVLRVDAETHPDLFWAIRGGGGNFGVVTRFQYRLHEVDEVIGGMLVLPATPEVLAGFVVEAERAPDELSTIANVMPAPPLPFLPPALHGELVVMVTMAYAGRPSVGRWVIEPFRALAEPLADLVRPMAYPEVFGPEPEGPRPAAVLRNTFVDRLDHAAAELILDRIRVAPGTMAVAQLRVLGGAIARVPNEATAFAHRDRAVMANLVAMHDGTGDPAEHERWAADFAAELNHGEPGAYVGFLGAEGDARVREAYPLATWQRLAAIKARYDPTNLFRMNQNVRPAMNGSGPVPARNRS